jgi:hypothetical protein
MSRFRKLAEILGLNAPTPDVSGVFAEDERISREAQAEARRVEFERYAASLEAQRLAEQRSSTGAVRRERHSLVGQVMAGKDDPDTWKGFDSYNLSSASVKRAGAETDSPLNSGPAIDLSNLRSMHLFQSPESYAAQFEKEAATDATRKQIRDEKANRTQERRDAWQETRMEEVDRVLGSSGRAITPVQAVLGSRVPMQAQQVVASPFGILNREAAENREAGHQAMRDARDARREAISRKPNKVDVNEDLAEKMRSTSVQQRSADTGIAAKLVSMAMTGKPE